MLHGCICGPAKLYPHLSQHLLGWGLLLCWPMVKLPGRDVVILACCVIRLGRCPPVLPAELMTDWVLVACLAADQMATRSKLSSVSWNAYVRSRLVTADYDGLIQLWDVGAGGVELQHFDEHARRVWSVDFSKQDPTRFLSGSDDGTGKWWLRQWVGPVGL